MTFLPTIKFYRKNPLNPFQQRRGYNLLGLERIGMTSKEYVTPSIRELAHETATSEHLPTNEEKWVESP